MTHKIRTNTEYENRGYSYHRYRWIACWSEPTEDPLTYGSDESLGGSGLIFHAYVYHPNFPRCKECNKQLNLDSYASHQGIIYCKPHHRDLFKPKAANTDISDEITKRNLDFAHYDVDGDIVKRHKRQEQRMETIVRENNPVELAGVIKSKVRMT